MGTLPKQPLAELKCILSTRLEWDPYARGAPGATAQRAHTLRWH